MSEFAGLGPLEDHLGYKFSDRLYLCRALTHASVRTAGGAVQPENTYQRLEFLGDRVLGLVIADLLHKTFPDAPEGELSRRLARLVSGETCAQIAQDMNLDHFMRVGGGLKLPNKRAMASLRADMCEGVIGAVYRDGGLEPARALIERLWGSRVHNMEGPLRDPKTQLQEWAHKNQMDTPYYREVGRSGPDHAPKFEIEVAIGKELSAKASGPSKREAAQEAAASLLRDQGVSDD